MNSDTSTVNRLLEAAFVALLCLAVTLPARSEAAVARYAIQLRASKAPIDLRDPALTQKLAKYTVYLATTHTDGDKIYRLRVGFFATRHEAEQVLETLAPEVPEAWIDFVPKDERAQSQKELVQFNPSNSGPQQPTLSPEASRALLEEGRTALLDGNNSRAIQLYSKVADGGPTNERMEAKELLGVAREKQGQLAQAKAVYER